MKKFLISLAVACLLACIAVSAFAAPVNDQWIKKATVDVQKGTVTFETPDLANVWTEMRIFAENEKPEPKTDGTDEFWNYYKDDNGGKMLARIDNATCTNSRVVGPEGTEGINSVYNFEEGKTYYIMLFTCDGNNWNYSTAVYELKFSEESKPTADFSVIAYAVAAITGCGALVVAKKRG